MTLDDFQNFADLVEIVAFTDWKNLLELFVRNNFFHVVNCDADRMGELLVDNILPVVVELDISVHLIVQQLIIFLIEVYVKQEQHHKDLVNYVDRINYIDHLSN